MKKKKVEKQLSIVQSAKLKILLKNGQEFQEGEIYLRLHRAISWMQAAETNSSQLDLKFISLWISFNACYAIDNLYDLNSDRINEKDSIYIFLCKLIEKDNERRIFNLLWNRYSTEVRVLLENQFIFNAFWEYIRGKITHNDFKILFNKSNLNFQKYFQKSNVAEILTELLKRLYVLRNQLFHGGATYNGRVNRKQLKDACGILEKLVPIIIEIMIDNKGENWGKVSFPLINKPD